MEKLHSLPQVIDETTKLLIVGSMPGTESLRKQQYYANKSNMFWKIIYSLFDTEYDDIYEKRIEFLKNKNIGLWDVLAECTREGSADSNIREVIVNNFERILEKYPAIKYICFNGKKAYDIYQKKVGFNSEIVFKRLESTSAANAKSLETKIKSWEAILEYLT